MLVADAFEVPSDIFRVVAQLFNLLADIRSGFAVLIMRRDLVDYMADLYDVPFYLLLVQKLGESIDPLLQRLLIRPT